MLLTSRCSDAVAPTVERREFGRWRHYGGRLCLAIYDMSPVALGPGETRQEVFPIQETGEYRLIVETEYGPVVSPGFVVR
ncbi:MAG TPA: hypothetical protein VJ803_00115 [Gemmatimonadaceae bacterium]|nr:hypothetical protein [Gemmatimonadaceae bacterium]